MTLLTDRILVELLDAAPDAMLSFDRDGLIVMANLRATILFGYERHELIGTPFTSLVSIDLEKIQQDSSGVLSAGHRHDGKGFLAEISLSAIANDSSPLYTATVRDVSARSELEAERVRVKSEAERVRLFVEAERIKAEGEKTVAEQVRLEAEAALVTAKGEKSVAERVRLEVAAELVTAEDEKAVAERVRVKAEAALVTAEDEKAVAERVRLEAEVQRVKAEGEKAVAERVRLEAEVQRVKAEGEKAIAERVRLEAEVQRVKAEGEKTEAERVRLAAEVQRVKAEVEKAEAERVRLEAEVVLERLEGQLHQSQRMESLGQLAGGVAHDFNNLLAVILNYASFVTEELSVVVAEPTGSRWEGTLNDVKQIQVAAERASVLTHQLLAFARRDVIQARPLSFNGAVTSIEEILRRTIGEQIELTIKLEPNLAMVVADPGHIEQIILNLAINARDAMPSGGTLTIETSSRTITEEEWTTFGTPAGSYICVRISDNGVGMSAEVRDRAFEPFFTTKPRGEGSGLGLATVYGIVLQTGGFTKIYSDEGVGTTITVLLPVDPKNVESAHEGEGLKKAKAPVGSETILVVDDEEGLREVTRRILTRSGYTVLVARSGAEAIEIASTHGGPIDLLLTDVIMPQMQGPTVAKEVKILKPSIRVLFMSGHAQPVLEAESVIGTQFQLVEKPFDQSMLLKSVRGVLDADLEEMSQPI
jgi:PAS domain S-box-containing protein